MTEHTHKVVKDGWEVFKDRILTGYGANNYLWATGYGKYAHNNFIEILVDFGIIGFWIYYSIYLKAFKNLSKIKTDEGKAIFCVFMVKFFMEMAMVSYSSKITWIMMAFFLMKSPDNENSIEGETTYDCIAEKIEKSGIPPVSL